MKTDALQDEKKTTFRYNMSFYYQSIIIYFIAGVSYAVIRGRFLENRFELIIHDPVIYFFALIVSISIIALLYNIYLNKHLEFSDTALTFVKGRRRKSLKYSDILDMKISRDRKRFNSIAFSLVRLKLKGRKLPVAIRPYDYENSDELIARFFRLKSELLNK